MNFLCDTNIVSEVMRKAPDPKVTEWFAQLETACFSVITLEEIYCGLAYKDARRQREWVDNLKNSGHKVTKSQRLIKLGFRRFEKNILKNLFLGLNSITCYPFVP